MGKIGSSPEDSIADTKLLTIPLHHKTIEHFITIYVSSFLNSHMSGIGGEIILGSKRNIINIKNYLSARDILFAGAILALGLLHLSLAIVSRNDITLWSMSVYCIWAFLAAPLSQSKLIFYIPLTWEWKMKIIYSSGTLAAASVSLGILYLFKEDMNKKIASLQLILAILHSTCILVNPIHIFSEIAKQYLYVITFFFFYTLYVLVKATLKKRKNSIFGIILSSVFILSVLYKFIRYFLGDKDSYSILQTQDTVLYVFFISFFTFIRYSENRRIQNNYLLETIKSNELKLQKQKIESESFFKDRLFSIISHDLRTPIHSLCSYFEIYSSNKKLSRKDKNLLIQNIREILYNTSYILEELLIWSSSKFKNSIPNKEPINIKHLVSETIQEFSYQLNLKQIKILMRLKFEQNLLVDRMLTKIIIRNLLANAVKFTPNKGEIIIQDELNSNEMLIQILNSGELIDKEVQEGLFQLEKNLKNDTIKKHGFGLYLSSEFADRQNLRLNYKVIENKNCFEIYFPLHNNHDA
jgi:signal transduction histidine kinase